MTSNAFSLAGVLALLLVACAAALDVLANLLLARSDGFRRRLTGCAALVCIGAAFYCLSLALHHMDLSVAYALWGSFGILGTSVGGWIFFRQKLRTGLRNTSLFRKISGCLPVIPCKQYSTDPHVMQLPDHFFRFRTQHIRQSYDSDTSSFFRHKQGRLSLDAQPLQEIPGFPVCCHSLFFQLAYGAPI